jgi:hypothetical protein
MELAANVRHVKPAVDQAVQELAQRGFRSLGVARADGDGAWQFVGVLPLFDPPRTDAKAAIATAEQMGVTVKMVTGDAIAIAQETARALGMGTDILDASGLGDAKKKPTAAEAKSIEEADGFAQVFPEHKFHLVDMDEQLRHLPHRRDARHRGPLTSPARRPRRRRCPRYIPTPKKGTPCTTTGVTAPMGKRSSAAAMPSQAPMAVGGVIGVPTRRRSRYEAREGSHR